MRNVHSSGATKYHIALDGIRDAACSRSIALIEETLKDAGRIPNALRCQRCGCKERTALSGE
jgi:hypothetical protein